MGAKVDEKKSYDNAAARKAAEDGEKKFEEITGRKPDDAPPVEDPKPVDAGIPEVKPPAPAPAPGESLEKSNTDLLATLTPKKANPEPVAAAVPPVADDKDAIIANLTQQLSVLKGKYDAETKTHDLQKVVDLLFLSIGSGFLE